MLQVVDPNTLDYESEYESDDGRQSDMETNDLEGKNVSMCKFCDHAFTDKVFKPVKLTCYKHFKMSNFRLNVQNTRQRLIILNVLTTVRFVR